MLGPRELPLLPVFVAVATAGSFTQAARELGLAKSVVSQHVRTLEAHLDVRLIERTTRRLHVTQVGLQVLEAAQEALGSVRSIQAIVEGHHEMPTGVLRVTAPPDLEAASVIAPVAATLMRRYAELRVELDFDATTRDLVAHGFDLALRLGPLRTSSYVARRIGVETEILVASPSLVATRGTVEEPRELKEAPWIASGAVGPRPGGAWTFRSHDPRQANQAIPVDVRASANSVNGMRAFLYEGIGYGILPAHMTRADIEAGRLVHICPKWYGRRIAFHALMPTRKPPPRVRVFLSALEIALVPFGFRAR